MEVTIAIAQLRPKKGDYSANVARVAQVFAQLGALQPRPDVLVLPETALTGYFLEGGVREAARPAGAVFADLQAAYLRACGDTAPPLDIVAGFYERFRDRFYNSALYATLGTGGWGMGDGEANPTTDHRPPTTQQSQLSVVGRQSSGIRHVHRKVFLPTYGVFDEARFVEAGHQVAAFDTRYGRVAVLICEDAWHSISGTLAALDGAQVVYVASASPARGIATPRPANVEHWEDLLHRIADEHGVFGVLAQLVGFEGGKGFPGGSFVIGPRGEMLVTGPLWDEALITATLDLAELPIARADLPLLADMETMLPHLQSELARTQRGEPAPARWDAADTSHETRDARHETGVGSQQAAAASETHNTRRVLSSAERVSKGAGHETGVGSQQAAAASETHDTRRVLSSAERVSKGAGHETRDTSHETRDALTQSAKSPSLPASQPAGLPVVAAPAFDPAADFLRIDAEAVRRWLVAFLRDEVRHRRGFDQVVVGLSGGVDSALVVYLCAQAFGPEHVLAVRMPYRSSSRESLDHAQLCIDALGVRSTTVDISDAVDGYARLDPAIDGRRKGNIMARTRMIVLFDQSQKLGCIPVGTGNKTERLFGYYTWHADDSPPVNPLGDLFKSQVWQLARHVGVPEVIVGKPASADLVVGQTDEADFGISYPLADKILHFLLQGYPPERIAALGFRPDDVAIVKRRLDGTHWKRHLPSVAMLSATAIGEYYLRPLDY